MNLRHLTGLLSILLLIAGGCKEKEPEEPKQTEIDDKLLREHFAERDIEAQKDPTGLYFEVLRTTNGRYIKLGEVASVYYTISLLDGKILEARLLENSEPLKFVHATGGLVPVGINEGIALMRKGEIFRFYIPSEIAFEDFYVRGFMGPNSLLVAEIELVNIETLQEQASFEEDSIRNYLSNNDFAGYRELSSGVFLYTTQSGEGSSPGGQDVVEVKLGRKYLDNTPADFIMEDTPVSLDLSRDVTEGLRQGILNMRVGEKAIVLVPSHLAFGGVLNNINGSIQVFPQKFRNQYISGKLSEEVSRQLGRNVELQNIYPLAILKYEVELLRIL